MSWIFRRTQHAELYKKYRPEYPTSVYNVIIGYLAARNKQQLQAPLLDQYQQQMFDIAIDIGCGTGQSTLPLSVHFKEVIGVDSSDAQLEQARKASTAYSNISYRNSAAHDLSFQPGNSVDLITVAQAMHWFDRKLFFGECQRLLKSRGVLAAYGCGFPRINNSEAQRVLLHFHDVTLGNFWETSRGHVLDRHSAIFKEFSNAFPKSERNDSLVLEKTYSIDDFVGYLSSWSAYQKFRKQRPDDDDPLVEVASRLKSIFLAVKSSEKASNKDSKEEMFITSSIFILLGRKE